MSPGETTIRWKQGGLPALREAVSRMPTEPIVLLDAPDLLETVDKLDRESRKMKQLAGGAGIVAALALVATAFFALRSPAAPAPAPAYAPAPSPDAALLARIAELEARNAQLTQAFREARREFESLDVSQRRKEAFPQAK